MKQFQLKALLAITALTTILASCSKDNTSTPEVPAERAGIYVLNEGGFGGNNSSLSYYSYATKTTTPNIFSAANAGAGLGDTGNDVQVYGSKMYIVVNVSSTIEVVNAKTTKSIKQLKLKNDAGVDRQPRFIVFDKNKAFITTYDGKVAVLDTATLTIDKYINVGRNPEQMVISNGKLYVANSGGLDSFTALGPDKTVSVIDLTTLTETKKIEVGSNPINIAADTYGDVYVISYGTDYPAKPVLTIINNVTDVVKSSASIDAGYAADFLVNGDVAYYLTAAGKVKVYNVKTDAVASENFITDGTAISVPYAIAIDRTTGELFVTDAIDYSSNGLLFAFDKTGKKEYSVTVGINPGAVAFVNK